MKQYHVTFYGQTGLLMHRDDLAFSEKTTMWRKDPQNRELSAPGDDRSPAWTWIGYLYHNRKVLGIPQDNIMTMIREGATKVLTGRGKETYKKQSQAGIMIDGEQFDLYVGKNTIAVKDIYDLVGNSNFINHIDLAESLNFELNVKRVKVGRSKHIRVRPLFRDWHASGKLTVIDEELTGLTEPVLNTILKQSGGLCGLCDWRPSSPYSPGSFGKFEPKIVAL